MPIAALFTYDLTFDVMGGSQGTVKTIFLKNF